MFTIENNYEYNFSLRVQVGSNNASIGHMYNGLFGGKLVVMNSFAATLNAFRKGGYLKYKTFAYATLRKNLFKEFEKNNINSKYIYLDVVESKACHVRRAFKDYIIIDKPFINTTGNRMVVFVIRNPHYVDNSYSITEENYLNNLSSNCQIDFTTRINSYSDYYTGDYDDYDDDNVQDGYSRMFFSLLTKDEYEKIPKEDIHLYIPLDDYFLTLIYNYND